MKSIAPVLLLLWAGVMLQACSQDAGSPEDEIRRFIESGVAAAESRSSDELGDMIHASYRDRKGYNRKQLTGLLRAFFFRHKDIHLFSKIAEIDLPNENQATVKLYVAMAGSVISDIEALSGMRAEIYKFELQLVKDEEWLLQHAEWRPAGRLDLE